MYVQVHTDTNIYIHIHTYTKRYVQTRCGALRSRSAEGLSGLSAHFCGNVNLKKLKATLFMQCMYMHVSVHTCKYMRVYVCMCMYLFVSYQCNHSLMAMIVPEKQSTMRFAGASPVVCWTRNSPANPSMSVSSSTISVSFPCQSAPPRRHRLELDGNMAIPALCASLCWYGR